MGRERKRERIKYRKKKRKNIYIVRRKAELTKKIGFVANFI